MKTHLLQKCATKDPPFPTMTAVGIMFASDWVSKQKDWKAACKEFRTFCTYKISNKAARKLGGSGTSVKKMPFNHFNPPKKYLQCITPVTPATRLLPHLPHRGNLNFPIVMSLRFESFPKCSWKFTSHFPYPKITCVGMRWWTCWT